MSVQLPPNSSGSVVATLTSGGVEYQKNVVVDGVAGAKSASVLAPGTAAASEVGLLVVRSHMAGSDKPSYGAALTALAPGTSATTVIAQITGSATKVIRVTKVTIAATEATAAAYHNVQLVKSSTAIAGGTPVAGTSVPYDSGSDAATVTVQGFSAAPTAGTATGAIANGKLFCPITGTPAAGVQAATFNFGDRPASGVVLRGVAQSLDVKFNGETPANAMSCNITFEWTEE